LNITIANAHWNNRGDEAAHRALWAALVERYPGCKLTILFKDRKAITWFPPVPGARYVSAQFDADAWDIWTAAITRGRLGKNRVLKDTIRILSQSDLIVYAPGGSVISDRFFWRKQLEYLTPFLCARLCGVPIYVAAPSMGPYDSQRKRLMRRWLLRTPIAFCVRESLSRRHLEAIGVVEKVEVTADLAFMGVVNTEAAERQISESATLRSFFSSYSRVIGITITDLQWHVELRKIPALKERIETTFQKMISSLLRRGYGVLLIPQLFGNQNDFDDLKHFSRDGVHVLDPAFDSNTQQQIISKLYALIGMRYHSNLFAAKMGIPFVAIIYEEKMTGFIDAANLRDYAIPVQQISYETLMEKFAVLESNYEAFREHLVTMLPEWKARAERTVELLPTNTAPSLTVE
jgi:colanic acid/amylovoran biosynthesis protein